MIPSEGKVLSFMDDIDKRSDLDREKDELRNSLDGKLKLLDRCKQDAKNQCIDVIFSKIYNDATPFNDEYKTAYRDDLTGGFRSFIGSKSDKGMDYYIREAIKRSPFAKRIVEAVDNMIEDEYRTKEMNIENINPEELVFKSSDDTTKRLDIINKELSGDDISEQIRDQVKQTALSEIRRAKEEKEGLKKMEEELAKDPSITTQNAVETALELKGVKDTKFYTPSLFEGVMINKYNHIMQDVKEGKYVDTPLYGTMDVFKEEEVVIESVMSVFKTSVFTKFKSLRDKVKNKLKALKDKVSKKKEVTESTRLTSDDVEAATNEAIKLEVEYQKKILANIKKAIKLCEDKGIDPYSNDWLKDPEIKAKVEEIGKDSERITLEYQRKYLDLMEKYSNKTGEKIVESEEFLEQSIMDHAFVEAVKEYTALSMLKALRLESFSYKDVEMLAEEYAYNL